MEQDLAQATQATEQQTTEQVSDAAFDAAFAPAPQQAASQSEAPQAQAQSSQSNEGSGIIDLSDPSLQSAVPNYDPDRDMNAYHPLPDGDYIAVMTLEDSNDKGGIYAKQTAKSGTYLVAAIAHKISDPAVPAYDGMPVDTNWVTSIYSDRQGTSSLVDLLRCLGKPPARGLNLQQLGEFAKAVIGSGLTCKIRTKWEARSQDAQEAWDNGDHQHGRKGGVLLKGMKSFPQDDKGEYVPEVDCSMTGETKQARPKVQGYFPLK